MQMNKKSLLHLKCIQIATYGFSPVTTKGNLLPHHTGITIKNPILKKRYFKTNGIINNTYGALKIWLQTPKSTHYKK